MRPLEILERYAALGLHRTGNPTDGATAAWLEDLLSGAGARVERHGYGFPMVKGAASLAAPLADVPLLPLYYAGEGTLETERVHLVSLPFEVDHVPEGIGGLLASAVAEAQAAGAEVAVLTTPCPNDSLCAINRDPRNRIGFPICLAPGRALERLHSNPLHIRYSVEIGPGESENLTAVWRAPGDKRLPIMITTPTTGWFTCAGERGSGLAVALSVAQAMADRHPILLSLMSGHELGFMGGRRFAEAFDEPLAGVLHLGSCVADKAGYEAAAGRFMPDALTAVTNLAPDGFAAIRQILEPLGVPLRRPERPRDPACWIGESQLWAERGVPMLSIAGASPTFHTPEDTFEAAADPGLLQSVCDRALRCLDVLAETAGQAQ